MPNPALAAEFPAASRADWLAAVESVLKGASFDTIMRTPLPDGFSVEPVYERAHEHPPIPGRAPGSRWAIIQRVDHPDPDAANALALADLEGGADGLALVLGGTATARGHGLAAETLSMLDRALDGVMLDIIAVRLEAGRRSRASAAMLAALIRKRGLAAHACRISFGYDPVGLFAVRGRLSAAWPTFERRIWDLAQGLSAEGFQGPVLTVDGRPYHEAGASRASQLAMMVATGIAYLRALEAGGTTLDVARRQIDAVLCADTDVFMTMATIRALRLLWARVQELCGLAPEPLAIHAEQGWRVVSRLDPWSNMLRGTVAAFAAGVGGADSVTVLPFNSGCGLPDRFGRRVARNAQHILMAEAGLHRLADPAAGSGVLESMTGHLAELAWKRFQVIEANGGIISSLQSGLVQSIVDNDRAAMPEQLIVGVTKFPDPDQAPVPVENVPPPALSSRSRPPVEDRFTSMMAAVVDGASLGDLSPQSEPDGLRAPPLANSGQGATVS